MVFGPGTDEERRTDVSLDGQQLQQVSQFRYLGHVVTDTGDQTPHIKVRVSRAFHRAGIYNMFFRQRGLSWKVKGKILKVGVLGPALQGIELCCLTRQNLTYLEENYVKLLEIGLNRRNWWMSRRLSKEEMGKRLGCPPLGAYIQKRQLQFIGEMARVHDKQPSLPTMALGGRLAGDYPQRRRGKPPGTPMWRAAFRPALQAAVGGDFCSDRLARDKAGWAEREGAPLRAAAENVVRCEHCERHYSRAYIDRHVRQRHGPEQQQQQQDVGEREEADVETQEVETERHEEAEAELEEAQNEQQQQQIWEI